MTKVRSLVLSPVAVQLTRISCVDGGLREVPFPSVVLLALLWQSKKKSDRLTLLISTLLFLLGVMSNVGVLEGRVQPGCWDLGAQQGIMEAESSVAVFLQCR